MGKRQRSPPEGRRRAMGLHFISALNWAKEVRSPKRRSISHETLDSDSRKCDSQFAEDREGLPEFVSGAFFLCVMLLFVFDIRLATHQPEFQLGRYHLPIFAIETLDTN